MIFLYKKVFERISNSCGRSFVYGFIEPQTIQPSGNSYMTTSNFMMKDYLVFFFKIIEYGVS